jgi:hypothetical protein
MKRKKILILVACLSLIGLLTSISLAGHKHKIWPPSRGRICKHPPAAKYRVVSPRGASTVEPITQAPRLEDGLEGKTICLIAGDAFKTLVTFPKLEELLKAQYPGATVVPYTEFPYLDPMFYGSPGAAREAVSAAIQEKGCDAVISGNGG